MNKRLAIFLLGLAVLGTVAFAATPRDYFHPKIQGHGKVVRLPAAAEQPRPDSRICVDVTAGGDPESINPAVEKLARYVNIYAGAGAQPASVKITAILHGKATLIALNDDAYGKRFGTDGNPNTTLFQALREAGVELLVCGQALAGKEADTEHVSAHVQVAVSALTVNVNRQQAGYAYIPLH